MGEIIKLSDLPIGVIGIYKINYPDGKIYIGKSNNIKRRMWEHNNCGLNEKYNYIQECDKAIKKLGYPIQEVEILEYTSLENLDKAEAKWEKFYNARNPEIGYNKAPCGYGGGKSSIFSEEQILDIRKRRFAGERKINVYKDYNTFSFATFEKIWLGRTSTHIGTEYIIQPHSISQQEYSSKANKGENNGRAKLTENDVREIRKLYEVDKKTIKEISDIFKQVSNKTIRRICNRETWKDVI